MRADPGIEECLGNDRRILRSTNTRRIAHLDLGANAQPTILDQMQERLRHGQTEVLALIGKDIDHGAVHRGVDGTLIQPRTGRIKVCRRGIAQRFGAADIFLA